MTLQSSPIGLRPALRAARSIAIGAKLIAGCLDDGDERDALFARARRDGLASLDRPKRSGHLSRVVGEVAESVAELLFDEIGYRVFWHITTSGVHGVDLLLLAPEESVLALEVKGTLCIGAIPRLTPSRLRQMSREWLNGPDNPAMAEWEFEADDLYSSVMVVDFATPAARVVVSSNFESYHPIVEFAQLRRLGWLFGHADQLG